MTEESFGWGVVGLGRHFQRFLGPGIEASSSGRLVAVFGRDAEAAKAAIGPWESARVHGSLAELLADDSVDGVFLATANHVHHAQVIAAAEAGKHILCEKPLGVTVEECVDMVRTCAKHGVALGVGFHLRHNRIHHLARERIEHGVLGELALAEVRYVHASGLPGVPRPASWRSSPELMGGGDFVGTGVHAIDLLRYLTGAEAETLTAIANAGAGLYQERVIHTAMALSGGTVAAVTGGNLAFPQNEVVISGSLGTLRCTDSIGNYGGGKLEITTADGIESLVEQRHDVYAAQCDDFVRRVRAGETPNADGIDGLRATEVVRAIYESVQSGSTEPVHKWSGDE